MTNDKDDGTLTPGERLAAMDAKLDSVLSKLSGLPWRVKALEAVVYSGCGLCITAVFTALVALVIKH